jgi:anti-anti-sigma factor
MRAPSTAGRTGLHLRFEEAGGALLVTPLTRTLDAETAPELRDVVGAMARGRAVVVLSLEHVRGIDASALAALVSILKAMAPGGTLRLVGVRPPLRALLVRTHLDEVFPVFEDASAALR